MTCANPQTVSQLAIALFFQAAPAFQQYTPIEHFPGSGIDSDEAMLESARRISTSIFHPVGTCRMGKDDASVVDSKLRVRGLSGVRVVDASIMPAITSGNTNSPCVMIAEKAAEDILNKNAEK